MKLFMKFVNNPYLAEKNIHKSLSAFNAGKEWFDCEVSLAVAHINSLLDGLEVYKSEPIKHDTDVITTCEISVPNQIFYIKGSFKLLKNKITTSNGLYFCPSCMSLTISKINLNQIPSKFEYTSCRFCHKEAYLYETSDDIKNLFKQP